ncbi:thioredoxin domain-containing protein [Photobacterium lutimaris]|uniref:Peptide permease n=1 Tax=Photobacterium lutimaris TaxID=388278 RepID=A0A2T3J174_9GAMM|nr:thioredoxin domain-containing protein [Photobacterium lutimaris]PSU34835.1 peptide permease [Photobacterium lutimaris]TDR77169.1 thioredoxin-like protein [Photobacterium lutimaris]
MNTLTKIVASTLFFLVVLTGCSESETPKEGVKYTVVQTPSEDVADVVEVFSLGCGHCRNMELMLPEIKKLADVDIDQVHVTFNESAQYAAYLYYTAAIQSNGKPSPELKEALFGFVQELAANLDEEGRKNKLDEIFSQYNLVSPFDLNDEQKEHVYQQMTNANQLEQNAQITSVPAFLVKGKYLVQSAAHDSLEDLANTIRFLSEKQ